MSMTLVHRKVPPLIITLSLRDVALKLVGRVSREVSDEAVGIFQIEDLENGVVGGLVLAFYDGVGDAHFFDSHVVLENSFAMKTDPCVRRAGHRNLDLRIFLHVFVHIFGAVGCGGAAPGGIHPDGAWLQPEAHHGRHVDLGRELSGAE